MTIPSGYQITFPEWPDEHSRNVDSARYGTQWFDGYFENDEVAKQTVPVPFAPVAAKAEKLLFTREQQSVTCSTDVLASIALTLSRVEEHTEKGRDEHGRFAATASVAGREGFLNRPIVDEYGVGFERLLRRIMPAWGPSRREYSIRLTHDIDEIGIPFSIRSSLGHMLRRRRPGGAIRDFAGVFGLEPTYLRCVRELVRLAELRNIRSVVYWKSCTVPTRYDTGYDPRNNRVQRVIRCFGEKGIEQGVHPGYFTFGSPEAFKREVDVAREALRASSIGARQHYLRWSPAMWDYCEDVGLAHDSTVGYADRVGFRAGTCIPYRPWSFLKNRRLNLFEIPLIAMEQTLYSYMRLDDEQALEVMNGCAHACRSVGGVFTFLWHNSMILDPKYNQRYRRALDFLAGSPSFALHPNHYDALL